MTAKPKRRALGKGLSALIPDVPVETPPGADGAAAPHAPEKEGGAKDAAPSTMVEEGIRLEIPIEKITPDPAQPRKQFDADAIQALADSIAEFGVLQPLVLTSVGDEYEIVAGERRWRAAQKAGLRVVPAVIKPLERRERFEIALVENLLREDLNPIEEARGYQHLIDAFELTHAQVADRIHISRSQITNRLRLLNLPVVVQDALIHGEISEGHARALAGVKDEARARELLEQIIDEGLNVRQLEALLNPRDESGKSKRKNTPAEKPESATKRPAHFEELERRLSHHLGTAVKIGGDGDKGSLSVKYFTSDELRDLVDKLLSE